ncbi:MAG: hypothetical protein IJS01_02795 [Lentisphaeria bacterium]|nr:hypothetical protein [Lentisphaeria bacterium]
MEIFSFECGKCGQKFEADSTLRGGTTRCPRCGEKVAIPAPTRERSFLRYMTDPENRFFLSLLFGNGIVVALCCCLVLGMQLKQKRERELARIFGERHRAAAYGRIARNRVLREREIRAAAARRARTEAGKRLPPPLPAPPKPVTKTVPAEPKTHMAPAPSASARPAGAELLELSRKRIERLNAVGRRLEDVNTRLSEELRSRKTPDSRTFLRREILNRSTQLLKFSRKRIEEITRRDSAVAAAAALQGDPEKGRELQRVFRDYTLPSGRPGAAGKHRLGTKLLQLLDDPQTDPNIILTDAGKPGRSGPALLVVASNISPIRNELLKKLIRRGADPACLESGGYFPSSQLISYGLPEKELGRAMDITMGNVLRGSIHGTHELSCLICDGAPMETRHLKTAVRAGRWDILLLLLAAGYPPDMSDDSGETALFDAARIADGKLFSDLLLAAGADPGIRSRTGRTAASFSETGRFNTLWKHNRWREVESLLKKGYSADSILPGGLSLLADACRRNSPQGVALLLKYGADPRAGKRNGLSPFYFAERNRRSAKSGADKRDSAEILRLLKQAADRRGDGPAARKRPVR